MPKILKIMWCYFSRKYAAESGEIERDQDYGTIKDIKVHSIDHEEPPPCFKQKYDHTILVLAIIGKWS